MEPAEFKELLNRDAWGTIRGFVYQVDTTILRWLSLKENQVLELEKGEDIDIITKDINKGETTRELEQVKFREANITLNKPEVLEILLNFFLHKQQNPTSNLLFRFITNTNYGQERPSIFPDGRSGIEVWQGLSAAASISPQNQDYVFLKTYLLRKVEANISTKDPILLSETEKSISDAWLHFKEFIEKDEQAIAYIRAFDWSFKNDDHIQISQSIYARLIEEKVVSSMVEATNLYPRLFLYVFKLLGQKESKRLNYTDLLMLVPLPELSLADKQLLQVINTIIADHGQRIAILEKQAASTNNNFISLAQEVADIKNYDTVFEFRLSNLPTNPPALIPNGTTRTQRVTDIETLFQKYNWIGFQGINGTGKSQLANLVRGKFHTWFWLDLQGYKQSIEKTVFLIEAFLTNITGTSSGHQVYSDPTIFKVLPPNTLIVFNDLPKVEKNSALATLLNNLARNITVSGTKLLTTSNYNLPSFLVQTLPENCFFEYYDFAFTDDEINEYLTKSGANAPITKYVSLIAAISRRNPQIISSIIYKLKSINWGQDEDVLFDVIFKKEFSQEILDNAQESIKKYIADEMSRELLYRLSLIHWNFKEEVVKAICNIEQIILFPKEKLHDLVNVWVQKQADSYSVSPLIYDIGIDNLPDNIVKNVHITMAKALLSEKVLDHVTATRCIISFISGKEFNSAGLVLLTIYQSAKTAKEIEALDQWGYLNYWSDMEMPVSMSPMIKALLYHEKIRLSHSLAKDYKVYQIKLADLSLNSDISLSKRVTISLMYLSQFNGAEDDLASFWQHAEFAITNWKALDEHYKQPSLPNQILNLLWVPIQGLRSQDDLNRWLDAIQKAEAAFGSDFFQEEVAQTALTLIARSLVATESSKKEEEKNWTALLNKLTNLAIFFRNKPNEVLAAVFINQIITIHFNILYEPHKALALIEDASGTLTDAEAKYLIFENTGKLLYDRDQSESFKWLQQAINLDYTRQAGFIETLIYASAAISTQNSIQAVEYCKRAVELVNQQETYSDLDRIQLMGELGIAYWINENFEKSFICFEEVVHNLLVLKAQTPNKTWIRLFALTGHALGYIASAVAREKVPQTVHDGSDYYKPDQGFYSFNTKDLSDLYVSKNDPIILLHLATFAEGVNDLARSYWWAEKAFDLARKNKDAQIFLMVSVLSAQYALINHHPAEAFESYLLFSAVSNHIEGKVKEKFSKLRYIDFDDIFAKKPSEKWNQAEDRTVLLSILPSLILTLTQQRNYSPKASESVQNLVKLLEDYLPVSSDKLLWELVLELSTKILAGKASEKELRDRANTFAEQDRISLQVICIWGIVNKSYNQEEVMKQMVNIIPYIVELYTVQASIIKFVLVPFVRLICIQVLRELFVGSKQEYRLILEEVEKVDSLDKYALQLLIKPIIKATEIKLRDDRITWLNNIPT